ncbi:tumor necrosis factor receptor superfamily member 8 [Sorex araneus]|uniref:tumor necrosis factor receptor superfamily member 8 n=1 Tax=Sorex araneus TaxID=42254 RepID=UPI002433D4F2|nr:tumor necrosis factor receptor superfamily member 8 [Sorex araneus]
MRVLWVPALALLGALRAFPQDRACREACPGGFHLDQAGRCCCRCPEGHIPQQPCPQQAAHCRKRKRCDPDYYLSPAGRCTACVGCSRDDLVEMSPCSWNASRVCACRPGLFCVTPVTNSCARCAPHSVCPPGLIVKFQGTAESDTICGPPASEISSEDLGHPASDLHPAKPFLTSQADPKARTTLLEGDTPLAPENASERTHSPSPVGKPSADPHAGRPPQPCPPGSPHCRKQCDPDYYLDRTGRCMACVSCSQDKDLVEKTPCFWNASRVCACRPGLVCATSAANSCARCVPRPSCPLGTVAKLQGMAERVGTDQPPAPETHPDCGHGPEDQGPSSVTPSLSPLLESQTSGELARGPALVWLFVALLLVGGASFFALCHRRTCSMWLRHKLLPCPPIQPLRPKLPPGESRPGRSPTELKRDISVLEPSTEDGGLLSGPLVETCLHTGAAPAPENRPLLDASPARSPAASWDLAEPRGAGEHTNNRIEKIYIMKAETVIVGSVKTEVPEGRGPAGPEFQEDPEVDSAPHYPEQETEPPRSSGGEVMFSVEEEGKEDPLPTAASGD